MVSIEAVITNRKTVVETLSEKRKLFAIDVEKVKILRQTLAFTQSDLAGILGISKGSYSRRERGEYPFSAEELYFLSEVFDVEFGDLMIKESV